MVLAEARAVTLEVYGTLIDWETGIADALAPWARAHGVTASRAALLDAVAAAERARRDAHPELPYPAVLEHVFDDLCARFGVRPAPDAAEAFADSIGDWPAFPDSAAALGELARRYKLAAIVNVDGASFAASAKRLGTAFDVLVTAVDAGAYKPDPAPFERALADLSDLGVAVDEVLHTGRAWASDLEPAQRLGMATCRIVRPSLVSDAPPPAGAGPDLCFASMADFAAALGEA